MALNNDNQNVYIAIIDRTCLSEIKSAAVNTFQLSCFVEVAATLNFSQAAKNLGVSQPAVSHQIKALEDELGATLVSRSTRTVSLTDEGLQFLSYANDILYLAVRGSRLVSRSHASATRTLSIGVHGGIEAIALAPVLRGLIEAEPDVTPDVRVAPHSALLNMLESGTLDVVLEYRDPAGAPASATVFKRIAESPAALSCTHDHPFAQRDKIDADEIKRAGRIAICSPHASLAAIDTLQRKVLGHVKSGGRHHVLRRGAYRGPYSSRRCRCRTPQHTGHDRPGYLRDSGGGHSRCGLWRARAARTIIARAQCLYTCAFC